MKDASRDLSDAGEAGIISVRLKVETLCRTEVVQVGRGTLRTLVADS